MFARTLAGIVCVSAAGSMVAFPVLTPVAAAHGAPSHAAFAQETVRGTIEKVDLEDNWFIIRTIEDEHLRLNVNDETDYTLNGEASSRNEALKNGAEALITHEQGTASRVDVRTQ